jgi:hypothetical protein
LFPILLMTIFRLSAMSLPLDVAYSEMMDACGLNVVKPSGRFLVSPSRADWRFGFQSLL